MDPSVRETERKYDTDGPVQVDLGGLPGVAEVGPPERMKLDATYVDTDDLRLAARGVTLRRRTGGTDAGWHLKLPAGRDTRDEIRAPGGSSARKVPASLHALVGAYARGKPLGPVARVRTTRSERELRAPDGTVLAVVTDDEVHAQRLAGESATLEAWREIEVELSSGDPRLLDAVEQRVLAAGARPAGSASKALRVLGPGVIPPWPASSERVKKRSPAGDVVLAYVRRQASVILAVDPRVRRNEPDAVHQMRVALRRLRSTLTAYDRFLDRAGTGELAAEVRWLGTELGSVRDGEVLHARLRAVTEDLPEELVLGPVMARLQTDVLAPTLAGHEQVVSTMSGERYFALLDALDRLCTAPPLLPAAERPAAEVIPEALERALRKVRRALRAAVATPPGPQRDELLHDARKAAKRLRYAAEAAAVLGKHPRRLVGLAERVQEVLGERNDAVVAIDALRREALRAHAAGEAGFTYGLLVGEQRAVIRRLDERLDELVEAAADRRLRPS